MGAAVAVLLSRQFCGRHADVWFAVSLQAQRFFPPQSPSAFSFYEIVAPDEVVAERLGEREKEGELTGSRLGDYIHEILLGQKIADRTFHNTSTPEVLFRNVVAVLNKDFGAVS